MLARVKAKRVTLKAVPGLAVYVSVSKNAKTGLCACTYAAQASCPASCPFRGSGCYAEAGHVGLVTRRVNEAALAADATPLQVAQSEAAAIAAGAVVPGLPLRLHVVGDAATVQAAMVLAEAARGYQERGGGVAWTYTHAWRDVARVAWDGVSVLASVESVADIPAARTQGYAPAVVVHEHPADGKAWRAPPMARG